MTTSESVEDTTTNQAPTWRDAAVARSLDPARKRAEKRVQRFLDAAFELLASGDGTELTVQDVVDRSGQSLRSFYQYFGGKRELLIALLEESVRTTAEHMHECVAEVDDPLERLHLFVVEYHRACQPVPPKGTKAKGRRSERTSLPGPVPSPVLIEFAQQLLTSHPADAARVFVPIVLLFEGIFDAATEAGAIRSSLDRQRVTGVVLESIMFNAFSATIAGASVHADDDAAEALWDLLFNGLAT